MNGKFLDGSLRGMSLACVFHEIFASPWLSSLEDRNLMRSIISDCHNSRFPGITLEACIIISKDNKPLKCQ